MPGPVYFAWSGPLDAWSAAMLREDEEIFALILGQTEGNFPTLQIDLRNPRVGLLAAGRNQWCWLSYQPPGGAAIPIFRGRLIGVPDNLQDEVVRLQFVARPQDYQAQKTAVAATMKVAPFWDPVWLKGKVDDPDTVLEGYAQLWHIDRTTLAVTASDIIEGEDGTVDVTADDHFYDGMTITYGQTPLRRVSMTGTVTWDQTGAGTVDLTAPLVAAFQAAGSPLPSPMVASLTGDGLLGAWPQPGTSIGGGWSMGTDSSAVLADWVRPAFLTKIWVEPDVFPTPAPLPTVTGIIPFGTPGTTWSFPTSWEFPDIWPSMALAAGIVPGPLKVFAAAFPAVAVAVRFTADYTALRKRSETVTFDLDADVQSIITDPGAAEEATITLNSDQIALPIDPPLTPGGVGQSPLFDSRSPTYFKTGRGTQSFEYLLMLARARLLARARCVLIKFVSSWDFVIDWISCRYSIRLFDPRLPGGLAIGKITGYVLSYSDAGIAAEVTLGCTIGHGGTVAAAPGAPTYLSPGYVTNGYQSLTGGQIAAVPGQVVYLSFSNYTIYDDDGLDLFNMTSGNVLNATPAVNLTTTANLTAGNPKITALASTAGLLQGNNYLVSGALIPTPAVGAPMMVYDGSSAGTLSIAPLFSAQGATVTISGPALSGITVNNGIADQANIVNAASKVRMMPDPVAALKAAPTRVCVDLVSCTGGAFHVNFPMIVQPMSVPKTIDLEAP